MKSLFSENGLITRAQIRRAAIAYGSVPSAGRNENFFESIAKAEREKFENSKGGLWNYEDLIGCFRKIAQGGSIDQARSYLKGLTGPGEVDSKLPLFEFVVANTSICSGALVEVGAREIDLGESLSFSLDYDFSVRADGRIFCFLIFPQVEPFKTAVRNALIAEYRRPFNGMNCPLILQYVENPKISSKRKPYVEKVEFEHSLPDEGFRRFLRIFARENCL